MYLGKLYHTPQIQNFLDRILGPPTKLQGFLVALRDYSKRRRNPMTKRFG
jgi:hypothetical protein